ncbi:MAG TPA: metal-dependent hydrolase, partial [Agitococcus sp.]|nr:metal-dependent hydrolase [Agitococcus sp.]
LMIKHGYSIDRIDRNVAFAMKWYKTYLSPARQLAHTAAVEHFTALMAEEYLFNTDELDKMDPRLAPLWAWHAIEETEHKAVAFDVYKATVNNEWIRLSQMAICTVMFLGFSTYDFMTLMRESGRQGDVKMWAKGINYYWGTKGIFRKMIPSYFKYYRKDFHPWQHNSQSMVDKLKAKYLGDKA